MQIHPASIKAIKKSYMYAIHIGCHLISLQHNVCIIILILHL